MENRYWSVIEAAEYVGVTPSYIYQLVSARKIKYFKPGRRVLFIKSDLDEFMESTSVYPIGYPEDE